jgi:hypothetical protein
VNLLTVDEARALVSTGMSDSDLLSVIEREEAWLVRAYGPHYTALLSVTETVAGRRMRNLYLRRPIATVTSVTADGTLIDSDQYRLWGDEGRIERLPYGSVWGEEQIVVVYGPQDDNALRKSALIDLLRLTLSRSGLKSESVAGEYSYTAFENTDEERARVMRRLGFVKA